MDNKDTSTLPTISLVFPTRNRQDHLPIFLDCIYNLEFPKKNIEIITIINDSTDESEQILQKFKKEHESEYNKIYIKRYDLGTPTYNSDRYSIISPKIIQNNGVQRAIPQNETHKVYKNLAKHRNSLIAKAQGDFIFSVDTDIFVKKNTLTTLLNHITNDIHYVSAHICNGFIVEKINGKRAYDFTNAMYYDAILNKHVHYAYEVNNGLVKCSNSGAVFLISKKAYKSGARFDGHKIGEDFVFSQDLINRGFNIYCDTSHKLAHCMDLELLEQYKSGNWKY